MATSTRQLSGVGKPGERVESPQPTKRKRGRPRLEANNRKGRAISFRARPGLYDKLVIAAEKANRSLSAEYVIRLEQSLRDDAIVDRLDKLEAIIKALSLLLIKRVP